MSTIYSTCTCNKHTLLLLRVGELSAYRATWTPSFTEIFPDHEHKGDLDGDIFTASQQVVGCSKDEILRPSLVEDTAQKRPKKEQTPNLLLAEFHTLPG